MNKDWQYYANMEPQDFNNLTTTELKQALNKMQFVANPKLKRINDFLNKYPNFPKPQIASQKHKNKDGRTIVFDSNLPPYSYSYKDKIEGLSGARERNRLVYLGNKIRRFLKSPQSSITRWVDYVLEQENLVRKHMRLPELKRGNKSNTQIAEQFQTFRDTDNLSTFWKAFEKIRYEDPNLAFTLQQIYGGDLSQAVKEAISAAMANGLRTVDEIYDYYKKDKGVENVEQKIRDELNWDTSSFNTFNDDEEDIFRGGKN